VAAWHAAPLMVRRGSGLILNVASHGSGTGKSAKSTVILPYSVGKAALHRLNADMAVELRDSGVAVIAIWPPASRTEGVLAQAEVFGDLSSWREPIFTGRVVAAFVAAGDWLAKSGEALVVTDLAKELGVGG
jgi:NAD(P)-dependent dehydrogenase (short-subunit alcohol dehydrogenase family)